MKYTALILLFCIQANATYVSKFWLYPKSMQVQISNSESKSMMMIDLEYDALKMFLYKYSVLRVGDDKILNEINEPKDFILLTEVMGSLEYVQINGSRFGELDENFQTYSVFGSVKDQSKPDDELIKDLLYRLFLNHERFANAVLIDECARYL